MNIDATIFDPIMPDILDQIRAGIAAHQEEARPAVITVRIPIKWDKDSGKAKIVAKVQASLPVGEHDQKTIKIPAVTLMAFGGEHPGQTRIEQ